MQTRKKHLADASVLVALLGLVFVIGGVSLWYLEVAPAAESLHESLFELVMHSLFGGIILAFGIHIEQGNLQPEEQYAVLIWCYGGFTIMFVLSVWGHLDSILSGTLTMTFASDFVVFTSLGGAFGVIAGINWGRATRNRQLAERNQEQREMLALLTRLVSHDIRNDMAVINGYTEILPEYVDENGSEYVRIIQDRIDETVDLLENTSTLVKSIDEEREFESINLSRILKQEVETIRDSHPDVDFETQIPDDLTATADSLVQQLFSNLLQNAVFHNDVQKLTIEVIAQQTGDTIDVFISDTGNGIPPEMRERCFELGAQGDESGGDGVGLYLVSRLADLYGGSVELDESPSGGARFHVSLPSPSP